MVSVLAVAGGERFVRRAAARLMVLAVAVFAPVRCGRAGTVAG